MNIVRGRSYLFGSPAPINNMDITKLPIEITSIIEEVMKPLNPTVPEEILVLQLEAKIAQFLCFEGVRLVDRGYAPIPPNIYAMIFFKSGGGKNKPLKEIDNYLFKNWWAGVMDNWSTFNRERIRELTAEAEERYQSLKSKQTDYVERFRPRHVLNTIRDGTEEGLIAERETYSAWGGGSTFVFIEEFKKFIFSRNPAREQFLTMIEQIFDYGDSYGKVVKGDKDTISVVNVPCNALFTTVYNGFEEGYKRSALIDMLNSGFARRCFVAMPRGDTIITMQDHIRTTETLARLEEERGGYAEMVQGLRGARDIRFSAEALERYYSWHISTYNSGVLLQNEVLRANRQNLAMKAMKLATLFTAWAGREEITLQDFESAIYQVEYYDDQLKNLVITVDDSQFGVVIEALKVREHSTTEIRELVDLSVNRFSQWWRDAKPAIEEIVSREGLMLHEDRIGRNGRKYKLIEQRELADDVFA